MRSKRSISEKLLSWPDLVLLVFFIAFLALALAGSLSPADGTSTVGAASSTARAKGVTMSMLFAKAQVPDASSTGSWPCSARAPLKSESDTTVRCVARTAPKSSKRSGDGSTPAASPPATRGSSVISGDA